MFWASLVFLVRDNGDCLILKRSSLRGAHRGKWGLAGGKADRGEMPEDCAIRECFEETGFRLSEDELFFLSKQSSGKRDYYFFWARVSGEPRIDNEHEGWEWVPWNKIKDRIEVPTHSSVFDAFELAQSQL